MKQLKHHNFIKSDGSRTGAYTDSMESALEIYKETNSEEPKLASIGSKVKRIYVAGENL